MWINNLYTKKKDFMLDLNIDLWSSIEYNFVKLLNSVCLNVIKIYKIY